MEVNIKGLSKVFTDRKGSEVWAVNKMDLVIPDGQLVGLLGPSGCGKSTTLYMIAGLHKPTEGQIFFGETDVSNVPPEKRGIGLVFQNYALYPHLSVKRNISFPLDNLVPKMQREEKEAVIQEMATLVDIDKYLERKPKELSGGQQQRVAIARALAKKPKVLLLDEPLSNLDARLRLQTREEIKRIQRETKITTIFVTHDQEEAMSISDQIVVMKDGVVQQIGEPQYVYENPINMFVAKFLGTPAINIFDGYINSGNLHVCQTSKGLNNQDFNENIEEYKEDCKDEVEDYASSNNIEQNAVRDINQLFDTDYEGRERSVKIGIRPEAFTLLTEDELSKTDENSRKYTVRVNVSMIEHIGRDITIIGTVENQKNKVRIIIPSEQRNLVNKETLIFAAKRFFVFEDNGKRIK